MWMRDLGYIADVIKTSEREQPRELVAVRRLRHRARRFPAVAAASASMGAAFLAAIAIALPGRSGLIGEQAMSGAARNVSMADPPPRSLVLVSLKQAQGFESHPAPVALHRPQLP